MQRWLGYLKPLFGTSNKLLRVLALKLRQQWRKALKRNERPTIHFVPGQASILAEHNKDLTNEQVAESIRKHPVLSSSDFLRERVIVSPERVVTFDVGERAFSLVALDLPTLRRKPAQLIGAINNLNKQISETNRQEQRYDQTAAPGVSESSLDTPVLRAASLNWVSSSAQVTIIRGGPGARPVPAHSVSEGTTTTRAAWEFNLPFSATEPSQPVDVAILDTALCDKDRADAYAKWGTSNKVLGDVLQPNGPLEVLYAGQSHLLQMANFDLAEHLYLMVDHGLFAAGIVNTIAPSAKLKLVEVLNPYGAGTLETVLRGLAQVANQQPSDRPLVINLSLVINMPPADEATLNWLAREDPIWQNFDVQNIRDMGQLLQAIVDALQTKNVLVVAAAGNDGVQQIRPPARYPAALNHVIGVGALNPDFSPTIYSNFSDEPFKIGVATFGGAQTTSGDADANKGILGIFTSTFPNGEPNTNGWARWAGTSFATPIVSGVLAALIAQGHAPQAALTELNTLLSGPQAIGNVLKVEQGP